MRGHRLILLSAAALVAVCVSTRAAHTRVAIQPGALQFQDAPAAASIHAAAPVETSAPNPAPCCCAADCPRAGRDRSLLLDPAVITALLGLFGAWCKYVYDHWRRKQTINITVLTEVARLLEVTSAHLIWWSRMIKEKDTDQSFIPFLTPVFDSQMDNIGDLDRRYAGAIVRFYGYVKFINSMQETQTHYRRRRLVTEFDRSYEEALKKLISVYGEAFRPAFAEYGIKASYKPVSRRD